MTWGSGPTIEITNFVDKFNPYVRGHGGYYRHELRIRKVNVEEFEKATGMDREAWLFLIGVTILHEFVHHGEYINKILRKDENGVAIERGDLFEKAAYGAQIGGFDAAKYYINEWIEDKQQQEDQRKRQIFTTMVDNFSNMEEGTYIWNGNSWVLRK